MTINKFDEIKDIQAKKGWLFMQKDGTVHFLTDKGVAETLIELYERTNKDNLKVIAYKEIDIIEGEGMPLNISEDE